MFLVKGGIFINSKEINHDYEYRRLLYPEKYPDELKWIYKKRMGYDLNLDNPKKYTE